MALIGRDRDLAVLNKVFGAVRDGRGATRGRAVMVMGRRRVGKSRLVQEFCDRAGVVSIVFQATQNRAPHLERADFLAAFKQAGFDVPLPAGVEPGDWLTTLRLAASLLPDDRPTILVVDELPWLVAMDAEFEGALQTAWDRHLSPKPVLLLLIGSDVSVMESLQDHDRPFFGRAAAYTLAPLDVHAVQQLTEADAATAVDAWLVTGGFPEIVVSWEAGMTLDDFWAASFADPLSPLLVSGALTLLGEFPQAGHARAVLEAIGAGERTFQSVATRAGAGAPLPSGTVSPILSMLISKHVVAGDDPLSTRADTRNRRYRISDPYLRFWLAFSPRAIPLAERGLVSQAVAEVRMSWPSWRGRAVEPLVRASLERIAPGIWPDALVVGGWWNRANNPEVDLVGADRAPVARSLSFVGSVKWHETRPFDANDVAGLTRDAASVPGAQGAPLVAVSRTGFTPGLPLAKAWGPEDLVNAWA